MCHVGEQRNKLSDLELSGDYLVCGNEAGYHEANDKDEILRDIHKVQREIDVVLGFLVFFDGSSVAFELVVFGVEVLDCFVTNHGVVPKLSAG